MKNFLPCLILLLSVKMIHAETDKLLESEIKSVIVYQNGAQVSRIAQLKLEKGKTTLLLKGLPAKIDPGRIQVKGPKEVTITSVSHAITYLNEKKSGEEIEKLEKKKISLADSIAVIKNLLNVLREEKEMILANKSIGGQQNGVQVSELKVAADFFRARITEIEQKSYALNSKIKFLNTEMIRIAQQLLELNVQKGNASSEVKITVSAANALSGTMEITYVIDDAGWKPLYDIRIKDINKEIDLVYKALVYQNTGEDWKNIHLILSTGDPLISNNKPELSSYHLTFNNYYKEPSLTYAARSIKIVRGKITDAESGEPLPGATITVKGSNTGTVTDLNGNYILEIPKDHNTLECSYIGYQSIEKIITSGITDFALQPYTNKLSEVVVTQYSLSSKSIKNVDIKKKEYIPMGIQKQQTSTEFKIDVPYTIPATNKDYEIRMIEYQIPAIFEYSCVPKLSPYAYLIAKITDWNAYNLLEGDANLFFQEVFQGKTHLDLRSFQDTLSLSVGRDLDIVIERKVQKDFSSKKLLGTHKKEVRAWEISLRNNKDVPVNIEVSDQYPISNDSEITVEDVEHTGARPDETTGKLSWLLKLNPQETKRIPLKYTVKYPRTKTLLVE